MYIVTYTEYEECNPYDCNFDSWTEIDSYRIFTSKKEAIEFYNSLKGDCYYENIKIYNAVEVYMEDRNENFN